MARTLSEKHDNIAWFFEGIDNHLDTNDSLFLGGAILSTTEKKQVQVKLKALGILHREKAEVYRDDNR